MADLNFENMSYEKLLNESDQQITEENELFFERQQLVMEAINELELNSDSNYITEEGLRKILGLGFVFTNTLTSYNVNDIKALQDAGYDFDGTLERAKTKILKSNKQEICKNESDYNKWIKDYKEEHPYLYLKNNDKSYKVQRAIVTPGMNKYSYQTGTQASSIHLHFGLCTAVGMYSGTSNDYFYKVIFLNYKGMLLLFIGATAPSEADAKTAPVEGIYLVYRNIKNKNINYKRICSWGPFRAWLKKVFKKK